MRLVHFFTFGTNIMGHISGATIYFGTTVQTNTQIMMKMDMMKMDIYSDINFFLSFFFNYE